MSVSVSVPDDLYQKAVEIAKAQRISVDEVPSRIRIRSASWAMRTVRLRNGISIRERLLAISPQDRFYTYAVIESPLPIRDHESTVRFKSLNSSQTEVKWTAQFMAAEGDAKALADGVKAGVLDLGIEGLRRAATSK